MPLYYSDIIDDEEEFDTWEEADNVIGEPIDLVKKNGILYTLWVSPNNEKFIGVSRSGEAWSWYHDPVNIAGVLPDPAAGEVGGVEEEETTGPQIASPCALAIHPNGSSLVVGYNGAHNAMLLANPAKNTPQVVNALLYDLIDKGLLHSGTLNVAAWNRIAYENGFPWLFIKPLLLPLTSNRSLIQSPLKESIFP